MPDHSTETDIVVISSSGREILTNLHSRFDIDGDSLLSQAELAQAFKYIPTKDALATITEQFTANGFEMCQTIDGKMTLTGWLALWRYIFPNSNLLIYISSFTTRQDPFAILRVLCHWGIKTNLNDLLCVKKKRDFRQDPSDMPDTIQCYIFGAPRTGKSSLMKAFIGQEFDQDYKKTDEQHSVIHLFEYKDSQYYLVVSTRLYLS
jgi:Ras family protein T1